VPREEYEALLVGEYIREHPELKEEHNVDSSRATG